MIRKLRVRNFKGLHEVDLDLKPFNVLIGPNDTGKSSVLQALALYSRLLTVPFHDSQPPWKTELPGFLRAGAEPPTLELAVATETTEHRVDLGIQPSLPESAPLCLEAVGPSGKPLATLVWNDQARDWDRVPQVRTPGRNQVSGWWLLAEGVGHRHLDIVVEPVGDSTPPPETKDQLTTYLSSHVQACTAKLYRLRVERLAEAAPLVAGKHPGLEEDGFGLAAYLYDLRDRGDGTVERIEEGLRARLRGFERLQYSRVKLAEGGLGALVRFKWEGIDEALPARHTSDGALLFLTYLTIAHSPDNPAILLIEEPENGIHAGALHEVVQDLRGLSEGKWGNPPVQAILTTHSSLLVDWVQPEELIVCRRRDDDGQITVGKIADPDQVRASLRHIGLGEYWDTVGEEGLTP